MWLGECKIDSKDCTQQNINVVQLVNLCKYSNHLNTVHLNARFFWILDSMGVQYSNGKVTWLGRLFKYQAFCTINRLFSVRFSDHHSNTGPFDMRKQIQHLKTRLVWYSDGYCIEKLQKIDLSWEAQIWSSMGSIRSSIDLPFRFTSGLVDWRKIWKITFDTWHNCLASRKIQNIM